MSAEPELPMFSKYYSQQHYPDVPGANFRDTSQAAGRSIAPKAAALRQRIRGELSYRASFGATCDELEQAFNMPHQTVSARLREMNLKGVIVDSGKRRPTRTGRAAIVWCAKEPGR